MRDDPCPARGAPSKRETARDAVVLQAHALPAAGTALHSFLLHAAPHRVPWSSCAPSSPTTCPPATPHKAARHSGPAHQPEWVQEESEQPIGRGGGGMGGGWRRTHPRDKAHPLFLCGKLGPGAAAGSSPSPRGTPAPPARDHGAWDSDTVRDSERRELGEAMARAIWGGSPSCPPGFDGLGIHCKLGGCGVWGFLMAYACDSSCVRGCVCVCVRACGVRILVELYS